MKKKNKILLCIAIVLWLAAGVQFVMGRMLYGNEDILAAFSQTNSEQLESSLMVLAECPKGFDGRQEKEEALQKTAEGIGLVIDSEFTETSGEERCELAFEKKGRYAETSLKAVTMGSGEESADYLLVRLTIYKDTDSIVSYKERVEKLFLKAGYEKIQSRLTFVGSYAGRLSLAEMDKVADRIISSLSGSTAYENRREEEYTIYAYTGKIKEYVVSAGKKINIQIGMEYDGDSDKTKLSVATPIVNGI